MSDGTRPCRFCAGTGREPITDQANAPFFEEMTVADRWETIRDLVPPPKVGQIAKLADTGQRLLWDGEGWVGL